MNCSGLDCLGLDCLGLDCCNTQKMDCATYKLDREKAAKLIRAFPSPVMFLNTPPGTNASTFVDNLKDCGFNVISIDSLIKLSRSSPELRFASPACDCLNFILRVHKHIRASIDVGAPILIWGTIVCIKLIEAMFDCVPMFNYIYFYPQSALFVSAFKSQFSAHSEDISAYAQRPASQINAKTILKRSAGIYKSHSSHFERLLVVLDS